MSLGKSAVGVHMPADGKGISRVGRDRNVRLKLMTDYSTLHMKRDNWGSRERRSLAGECLREGSAFSQLNCQMI